MQNYTKDRELSSLSPTVAQPQVVIVTGYSGAGKNTVLRSLEDIGFFCVDNLPAPLLPSFFSSMMLGEISYQRIALGIDSRTDITKTFHKLFGLKSIWPFKVKIVFVTSSYHTLLKRFQETRRKHPLANNDTDVSDAILKEQNLMQPISEMADMVLDTDQFTIHELRKFVIKAFTHDAQQHMVVTLTAFGFKYGAPLESNLVFDVRFLPNPYFDPVLKKLDGTDQRIIDYLFMQPQVEIYWQKLLSFATYVIEQSLAEGRFSMNIAIGCTGGRHRSVALAYVLSQQKIPHVTFLLRYRDKEKETYQE
jgi:Predicted P-loop-containing kinase